MDKGFRSTPEGKVLTYVSRMHRGSTHPVVDLTRVIMGAGTEVQYLRKKLGLTFKDNPRRGTRFTEEDKAQALALFAEDMPRNEVASVLGFHPSTIGRHLPGYGWSVERMAEHTNMVREANREIRKVFGV